ncbi:Uncharacterized protein OS=Acidobacterium capsulatum (strain ATCC 51196 / DSM 11244 / JCM 7670) GN=ACP_0151 PE=4 SV=1 [Gemmataceae bacterium]|nr:Uncharacterized protein OS=Acidobacterium capsulatum (strain ATCC 51196 / DSM 11244 / JCM 7670) GN=ACP_0151 PE=4 SV=1 [Gemmataceae bacterium]VTT97517.1 Uncharacterized protein OS=Acidobacterium capsulatum (strain ATCC 51196 / DSM 11244 / JCM 7670) GN=ACP_0151 PE=4 SV=1 [Gemmataceae bacterium]
MHRVAIRAWEFIVGVALYIVAEREVPDVDTQVGGKALGRSNNLDRLAVRAGVRPLMDYFSTDREQAAAHIEELGEEPPTDIPEEAWFSAEDGLITVRGLLRHLEANPTAISDAAEVAGELREFEGVLVGLAAAGVRWHLAVDY